MRNETGFMPRIPTTPEILLKRQQAQSQIQSKRVIEIRKKYPDMTLAVIGWNTGLTRQRVHQILKMTDLNTSSRY